LILFQRVVFVILAPSPKAQQRGACRLALAFWAEVGAFPLLFVLFVVRVLFVALCLDLLVVANMSADFTDPIPKQKGVVSPQNR
jgi:hypothetical protein